MQFTVQIEFLLSGVVTIVGFAALLESIEQNAILGPLSKLFANPQTSLAQDAAIGTVFLGCSYFVGILVSVAMYDVFLRRRMGAIIGKYLQRDPNLESKVRSLPNYGVCRGDKKDDVYEAIYAFVDVHEPEAVQGRRSFETSIQRLGRGAIPGLLLLLVATIISAVWARQYFFHGTVAIILLLFALLALLTYLAYNQMNQSTHDEARYLVEMLALLPKPQPAVPSAPAGPEPNAMSEASKARNDSHE